MAPEQVSLDDRIPGVEVAAVVPDEQKGSRDIVYWMSIAWIVLIVGAAITADMLPLWSPTEGDFAHLRELPTARHPLGTDALGRDILSRLIFGARVSLTVGLLAVTLGMLVGGTMGVLAGFYRGRLETVIVSAADSILAFPAIVFLMVITGVLGQSMRNVIIGLAVIYFPTFLRLARANTLTFAQREFVLAATAVGAKRGRIILREIVPNVLPPLAAYSFIVVAVLIVAEGTLSFLGLGIPPPSPSWGAMIAGGRNYLDGAPHIALFPSIVMFLTVLSFNMIGDRLRERIDVRQSVL